MFYWLFFFFWFAFLGRSFFIPIAIGILMAMLLLPVSRRLERMRISRSLASLICVIVLMLVVIVLFYFMTAQITGLISDLPAIKQNIETKLDYAYHFIDDKFELPKDEQQKVLDDQLNSIFQNVGSFFTRLLYSSGFFITHFFIVSAYTFFFLNYRRRGRRFITSLLSREHKAETHSLFDKIARVANSYISGVFLVVLILSTLNTVALLIIGVEHALFFGALAGFLNIVPFIGSMVGSLIPVAFVLLTKESLLYPIAVGLYFFIMQTVESYLLSPNITGNKIKLNPMATILALLAGGLIWGIAGMILFIPFLGIVKVIMMHVSEPTPFSAIIGNEKEDE